MAMSVLKTLDASLSTSAFQTGGQIQGNPIRPALQTVGKDALPLADRGGSTVTRCQGDRHAAHPGQFHGQLFAVAGQTLARLMLGLRGPDTARRTRRGLFNRNG